MLYSKCLPVWKSRYHIKAGFTLPIRFHNIIMRRIDDIADLVIQFTRADVQDVRTHCSEFYMGYREDCRSRKKPREQRFDLRKSLILGWVASRILTFYEFIKIR